jgi:lipopolysaccharide/colanic/teichoic acid biosynthesis glycosyltransferase
MRQDKNGKWKKGIGGWIRDLSLDEFPQFFNVLKGDMSLVGTRPPTVDEWEHYEPYHRGRMSTKPGITGLWQISGRSKIRDFNQVVQLDREYIENWSLLLDCKILLRTVWVVFSRKGAM